MGGKFVIRFDDTQRHWTEFNSSPGQLWDMSHRAIADLRWLGIKADECQWQSQMIDDVRADLKRIYGYAPPPEPITHQIQPAIIGVYAQPFPYTPALTPEKVWFDFLMECGLLIRGNDLLSEFSLYCHWVELFGLPQVQHVYLPRLLCDSGADLTYAGETISKTSGKLSIESFRETGYTPDEVLAMLRRACLVQPTGDWVLENIKKEPVFELG